MPCADLPLIALSAGIRASPSAGVPFVTKPCDAEHLLATVARLLVPDDRRRNAADEPDSGEL